MRDVSHCCLRPYQKIGQHGIIALTAAVLSERNPGSPGVIKIQFDSLEQGQCLFYMFSHPGTGREFRKSYSTDRQLIALNPLLDHATASAMGGMAFIEPR